MNKNRGTSLRIPPQNIDAEKALLGSALFRSEILHEVIDIVRPASFYVDRHRIIFETILELFSKNQPVDLLTLSARLKEKNELDAVGGMSYLTEIAHGVPSSAHARHYADLVQKKFMMRELIAAAHHITELGYDEAQELPHILDSAEKRIFDITSSPGNQKFTELGTALTEAWERLDHLHKNQEVLRGVPTGFKSLDDKLAGLQRSDLVILAARPSMGKTSLALDIARHTAINHGTPVCIFSLEMSDQQLVDRMLAADAKVDAWRLRTGRLKTDDEFDRIRTSLDRLSQASVYIDDQPGNDIIKMRSIARRLKGEKGLGLIVVDYLQLMMLPGGRQSDSMVQQVTEISRSLKHLARELDVPVLALSQLSRAVEQRGGRPRLSDLRDSGSIEQDADLVMFIHREDKYNKDSETPGVAEILIEKHRNGPTGKVQLFFKDSWASFQDIDTSHGQAVSFEDAA